VKPDFVVVGNGPAGCIAASEASKKHETLIIGSSQRRMQCAGLVSVSGLERIGVNPKETVLNKIRGAKIFSPDGEQILVDAKKPKAYVLDRLAFDEMLLQDAISSGAEYCEDWVKSIADNVETYGGKKYHPSVTVLASGSDVSLHHRHSIMPPKEYLVGGQYEVRMDCDKDFVELYFNVPDFFSWVIPVGDTARVGLCVKGNPRPQLDLLLKRLQKENRMKSKKIVSESFGIIPIHSPSLRTDYGSIRLVGDAAGHVKASTGGGLVMGALAAKHICCHDYERMWRREIGRELKLHLLIHRMINMMSEGGKNRFFRIVSEYHKSLEEGGDMDLASKTLLSLAGNPSFLAKSILNLPFFFFG
jgi:digeranylgeranylglycerophospholipid reductase